MKKILTSAFVMLLPLMMLAQGWPANYGGVMLQGFYWDSYSDSRWTRLEAQADELAEFFTLVWVPQSANCGGNVESVIRKLLLNIAHYHTLSLSILAYLKIGISNIIAAIIVTSKVAIVEKK